MSKVQNIYDKLMSMKVSELLQTASLAIENKMDEERLNIILTALETRLQKRRMLVKMGMNLEEKDRG